MSEDLNKIRIATAPLTGNIDMIRTGKDSMVALDKRAAEQEVMQAVIDHMKHGFKTFTGARKDVLANEQWYRITVEPIEESQVEGKPE